MFVSAALPACTRSRLTATARATVVWALWVDGLLRRPGVAYITHGKLTYRLSVEVIMHILTYPLYNKLFTWACALMSVPSY